MHSLSAFCEQRGEFPNGIDIGTDDYARRRRLRIFQGSALYKYEVMTKISNVERASLIVFVRCWINTKIIVEFNQ